MSISGDTALIQETVIAYAIIYALGVVSLILPALVAGTDIVRHFILSH
jgi:hypothetical protein